MIMADLERLEASAVKAQIKSALESALLHVECHGDVHIHNDLDRTRLFPDHIGEYRIERDPVAGKAKQTASKKVATLSTPVLDETLFDSPIKLPVFHRKTHYRIVFSDVGTPLHECSSLSQVFGALASSIKGEPSMTSRATQPV